MNSRSGTEPDYVPYDKPEHVPVLPDEYESDIVFERFSQDRFVNSNGRKLLDFCKLNRLRICNGRMGMDKSIGKYMYVGSTGSSVVDYVLISESITDTISKFRVGEPNILSDHCAVYFSLFSAIQNLQTSETKTQPSEQVNKKFIWKSEETQNYRDTINLHEEDFLLLQTHLGQATSEQDINENGDRFSKLMSNICDPFFAKAVKPNNFDNITSNNTNKQPWFDEECIE